MSSSLQLALSLTIILLVKPTISFSHHKRPVLYPTFPRNMKHSEKVWTKPDFKHYIPQDFYYQNVKDGGVITVKSTKSQVGSHEKVEDVILKSTRNARKLHKNIVLPVNLDAAADIRLIGHKAVTQKKHRNSFYEKNHGKHAQAYDADFANDAPQVDPKYTNFLQNFLDTVNSSFWPKKKACKESKIVDSSEQHIVFAQ